MAQNSEQETITDGGYEVSDLPDLWRRWAKQAEESEHDERAIALYDCADQLEELMARE